MNFGEDHQLINAQLTFSMAAAEPVMEIITSIQL
jgi:hypothetical protein